MVEETVFRGIIGFLEQIGIYDVILPFLLVFTIIFAILEKTKVLGTETIEGKRYTKKNINAMVAFVISFYSMYILSFDKTLKQDAPKHKLSTSMFSPYVILLIFNCY